MSRLTVSVDPGLLEEARKVAGVRTKREAIDMALRELISRRRIEELIDAAGSGLVDMTPEELQKWRDSSYE